MNAAAKRPALTIVGASIRAAAWSAQRAGFDVSGGDLFADVDTHHWAAVTCPPDYPAGLGAVIEAAPPGPWMFTGGLENQPELIAAWAARRPGLWGSLPAALRAAREPAVWNAALAEAELPWVEWRFDHARLPRDGTWFAKRLAGSGGLHVEPWAGQALPQGEGRWFFQRVVEGCPAAALFVAGRSGCRLCGLTQSLAPAPWTGARGLQYAGSIGPVTVPETTLEQIERMGQVLTAACGLRGLFGVDGVLEPRGDDALSFVPVEINPRYTASMEILERAGLGSALVLQAAACGSFDDQQAPVVGGERGELWPGANRLAGFPSNADRDAPVCVGKAIYYTREPAVVSPRLAETLRALALEPALGAWADVPAAGSRVEAGWPVATALAYGEDSAAVLAQLRRQLSWLRSQLTTASVTAP